MHLRFIIHPKKCFQSRISHMRVYFIQFYGYGVLKVQSLALLHFCDQLVSKLADESYSEKIS